MSVERLDLVIEPDPLKIAAAAALVALAFVLYRRTLPPLGALRRAALAALRAAAFLLLVLFLLDPALVSIAGRRRDPVVPVLIDRSLSMTLSDGGAASRFERAAEAALSIGGLFDGAIVPVIPFPGGGGPLGPSDPLPPADGEGTDIAGALEAAVARYRAGNLAAIVLLTDGRVTRGIAGRAPTLPVPVFAVGFGDTLDGTGLGVEEVEYPRVTYAGVRERITAVIRYSLPPGRTATVRLVDGGSVAAEYTSAPLSGEGRFEAGLDWIPGAEGIRNLEVRAIPQADEALTLDNVEHLRISVLKERLRILCVDRHPDWDTAFLRDAARRSTRVDLESAVWSPDGGYRLTSGAWWSVPAGPGDLAGFDLVIVGDGEALSGTAQTAALKEYVSRGGGLLLLASERSLLLDPRARAGLDGILPIRGAEAARIAAGEFPVVPAPDAGGIAGRLSAPGTRFERLPPLPAAVLGFEPTARALVPFVIETGSGSAPLVAVQGSGEGACGVIAGVGLFRWRLAGPEGAEAHRLLISGLMEYLAGGHREPGLSILPGRTVYRTGERIGIDAWSADRRAGAAVRGEAVPLAGDGAAAPVTFLFRPDPERPGLYEALLGPLPPGEYEIRAAGPRGAGLPDQGSTRIAVEPVSVEMLQTSLDRAYLERIAAQTGGALIDPDRLGTLAGLVSPRADTVETRTVRSLRGSALLLASIVAALAAEWLLRKLWGLV